MEGALALGVAEHAGLLANLRARQAVAGALRAHPAHDPTMLADLNAVGPESELTPLLTACLKGDAADVQLLLAFGADPAIEGDVYDTTTAPERVKDGDENRCKEFPLSIAARDGREAIASMLLAHEGVDANQVTTDSGATALNMCCIVGNINICKMLLARDEIDVNKAMTGHGATPLLSACYGGHIEVMKLLLAHDRIDVNKVSMTGGGVTPLSAACFRAHAEIVAMLLARDGVDGVDVNKALTDDGYTPLLIACDYGHTEIVAMLLAHDGVDVNKARTDDGYTPLYSACDFGRTEIATMLLARDVTDVNTTTDEGIDPLYIACYRGHAEIVAMLLARDGIEVNKAKSDSGGTPLCVACSRGHAEIVTMLLARCEIDVNKAQTEEGDTPLYIACNHGHTEIVTMLLAHAEIRVNQATTNFEGATPLYTACAQGCTDTIRILLADGRADVHKSTADEDEKLTPLHATAMNGHLVPAQLLVVYGASLTETARNGQTPAQVATSQNHPVTAEWLAAAAGWSPLRVAAGCRLHKEAALLLRQGKIDPDDPAATSAQDILQLVATSLAKPAALPWQNGPPICKATIMCPHLLCSEVTFCGSR